MNKPNLVLENVWGVYKLVEHSQINSELNGLLIYSQTGYMSVNISGFWEDQSGKKEVKIAYAGTFIIEGEFIIHNLLVFDNPKRESKQPRHANLQDSRLILTDGAENPAFRIIWEKVR